MQDKAGNVLVRMHCNLGKLARKDPHLHCLIHLCLQQTSCSEAVDRLKELAAIYQKDPSAVGRLVGTDGAAVEDLVIDETTKKRIEQRRQKQKTRPTYSSPYDINPATPRAEGPVPESIPLPVFKVSSSTAKVFSTLFDKTQSRGAVHWVDFESALVELSFSVTPMWGSVYTFVPPEQMGARKLTLHRPHQSEIEGYRIRSLCRRLTRVYGWDEKTFEVA